MTRTGSCSTTLKRCLWSCSTIVGCSHRCFWWCVHCLCRRCSNVRMKHRLRYLFVDLLQTDCFQCRHCPMGSSYCSRGRCWTSNCIDHLPCVPSCTTHPDCTQCNKSHGYKWTEVGRSCAIEQRSVETHLAIVTVEGDHRRRLVPSRCIFDICPPSIEEHIRYR